MSVLQAIAVLLVRLWAASTVITNVYYGVQFLLSAEPEGQNREFIPQLVADLSISLLLAIVAWIAAPFIARLVLPKTKAEGITAQIDSRDLVAIGSFFIGGFYVVKYAPGLLVKAVMHFANLSRDLYAIPQISSYEGAELSAQTLTVLVATLMMLQPRMIAAFFRRVGASAAAKDEA